MEKKKVFMMVTALASGSFTSVVSNTLFGKKEDAIERAKHNAESEIELTGSESIEAYFEYDQRDFLPICSRFNETKQIYANKIQVVKKEGYPSTEVWRIVFEKEIL